MFSLRKLFSVASIVVATVVVVAAVVVTAGAAAAAVGMGAGMVASSLGASAATVATVTSVATTAATVGCGVVAAANVAVGASDITEVVTDGYNPIRDTVFDGNQEAYDTAKLGLNLVSYGIAEFGAQQKAYQESVEPKSESKTKSEILRENKENGDAFEKEHFNELKSKYDNAETQITVDADGTKTRFDGIAYDEQNNTYVIEEYKSSPTAPLTPNQKIAFDNLEQYGGIVVGNGKGIFKGGNNYSTDSG